jgi:hypothetical protein
LRGADKAREDISKDIYFRTSYNWLDSDITATVVFGENYYMLASHYIMPHFTVWSLDIRIILEKFI